tara:strand:+ start:343 stop:492 length:150 start_codon:yes stop_codon:yes gene_type:complete
VSNQKNQNMGVFCPHILEIEQNKNKENGKSAENKGKKMVYVLDFYAIIV